MYSLPCSTRSEGFGSGAIRRPMTRSGLRASRHARRSSESQEAKSWQTMGMVGQSGQAEPGTTGMTEEFKKILRSRIRDLTDQAAKRWEEFKFHHRQMELVCEMMGYPLVEPGVSEPNSSLWTAEAEQYYRDAERWTPIMLNYGYDAAVGRREVAWDDENKTVLISGLPGEPFVSMNQFGQFVVKSTEEEPREGSTGSVGYAFWIGAGIVVVAFGIGYLYVDRFLDYGSQKIEERKVRLQRQFIDDQRADGVPMDKAVENSEKVFGSSKERAKAEIEKENVSPFAKVTKTAESALNAIVVVAAVGAAVYGISVAYDWTKDRRRKAT